MNRSIIPICIVFAYLSFTQSWAQTTRIVFAGSKWQLELVSPVSSSSSHDLDPLVAKVVEDIDCDGRVIIPAGSIISGKVHMPTVDPRLTGVRAVELKFEAIELNGEKVPIEVYLVSRGGQLFIRRGEQNVSLPIKMYMPEPILGGILCSYPGPKAAKALAEREKRVKAEIEVRRKTYARYGLTCERQVVLLGTKKQPVELLPGDRLKIEFQKDWSVQIK